MAVGQTRERVGPGAFLRFVQRSRITSSSRVDSTKLASSLVARVTVLASSFSRFSTSSFGSTPTSLWSATSFMACICERLSAIATVEKLLCGSHHRMELLRNVVEICFARGMRRDIGREQVVIGGGVKLSLVADQNIDGPFEIG